MIANACIQHYRLNEPLVIATRDAAALHQTRVAMRRLRSAFTLFRPALHGAEYQRLRNELRWFTAQLGDARNLDVYLGAGPVPKRSGRLWPSCAGRPTSACSKRWNRSACAT